MNWETRDFKKYIIKDHWDRMVSDTLYTNKRVAKNSWLFTLANSFSFQKPFLKLRKDRQKLILLVNKMARKSLSFLHLLKHRWKLSNLFRIVTLAWSINALRRQKGLSVMVGPCLYFTNSQQRWESSYHVTAAVLITSWARAMGSVYAPYDAQLSESQVRECWFT